MLQSIKSLFDRDIDQLKFELELTSDADLWKTPKGVTNSIGNLSLHICGNLKHFLGAVLHNSGYKRERDREFSDKLIPKETLLKNIGETKEIIHNTLNNLGEEDIKKIYPVKMWNKEITTAFFLIHLHSHLSYHMGQINYLRRILSEH